MGLVISPAGSGGSAAVIGSSTFNGTTGRAITHSVGSTSFSVAIIPTADPGGTLGYIYVAKTTTNFTVYNTGSFIGNFDYILSK